MAVKLYRRGFEYAQELAKQGNVVLDDRDAWSEHQPSTEEQNEFIHKHGIKEFGDWHLGVDDAVKPNTKGYFKFPYGDFKNVHRCGVLSAESRAGQYKYLDIERAAAHLHGMLDALAAEKSAA